MMNALRNFWMDEEGASAVEYGILVALIAAIIVGAVTTIGTNLKTQYDYVAGKIPATAPAN